MQGSLCLKNGVLYVGRSAKTASVASYDLDGHPLQTRFTFRDAHAGISSVSGLDVDDDHRIWVADGASGRLRGFTLFGREIALVGAETDSSEDLSGSIGLPVDVAVGGSDDTLEILVASRGIRRHALQSLQPATGHVNSLRPLGDPRGQFQDLVSVGRAGDLVYACERRASRIQVFRQGDFHFAFQIPASGGGFAVPSAVAVLDDRRALVTVTRPESALLLVDRTGTILRVLASAPEDGGASGAEPRSGEVRHPSGVVVEAGERDRDTRLAVLDCDGERVQVFNLESVCYGAFQHLANF